MTGRRRLEGAEALCTALAAGHPVALVLARRAGVSAAVQAALDEARGLGVEVREVSDGVLRRFSSDSTSPAEVLAVVGAAPHATLTEVMDRPGDVWLLSGLGYAGNIGGALRTLEVCGAAGVVVDAVLETGRRRRALRASMHAELLFPVLFDDPGRTLEAARGAGRAVVALETSGTELAAGEDLPARVLLVAGGERDGLPPAVLQAADRVLRLPTRGFIPSFNVQVALAIVAARRG